MLLENRKSMKTAERFFSCLKHNYDRLLEHEEKSCGKLPGNGNREIRTDCLKAENRKLVPRAGFAFRQSERKVW